jgi:2-polyprenyl-3-methyl-5-hydroxy-6-metoxy-1,4-benzoquinol methylase
MNLKKLQENWNAFGETDPLWSILTYPDKKGNKWEVEKFFETGAQEIGIFMAFIKSLDRKVQFRKALDFGCGVGRLSQALAAYFEEVHGVDIAPSMIELGKKYNPYGNRCTYHLNEHDDLSHLPR